MLVFGGFSESYTDDEYGKVIFRSFPFIFSRLFLDFLIPFHVVFYCIFYDQAYALNASFFFM